MLTWEEYEKSNKRKSAAITFGICALLVLMLLIMAFTPPYPPEEPQGMTIDFGDSNTGLGSFEPNSTPSAAAKYQPAEQETATQDLEETITLPDKKETKPKTTTNQNSNSENTSTINNDELFDPSKIDNKGSNSSSEGNTTKGGNQGSEDGIADGGPGSGQGPGGNDWSLAGRNNISLPKPPSAQNQEGDIRIKISVDRNGNVVKAEYEASGSTNNDPTLISQAIAAAKKAKFTAKADANAIQIGYITYKYRYN